MNQIKVCGHINPQKSVEAARGTHHMTLALSDKESQRMCVVQANAIAIEACTIGLNDACARRMGHEFSSHRRIVLSP